jgi:transcriptional regulator with XRE-family HTH domain
MATTPLNQLAGNLLKQGRQDAGGGGRPVKQEAYARQLAAKLGVNGLARQTLSAWERGATVVPAAALLASAEVLGVDVGQLVEATRESVREKIANLEALVATAPSGRSNNGAQLSNRIELNKGRATTKR